MYPIGRPVRATITLYPIGRPVRATITLYPIGRPVRATRQMHTALRGEPENACMHRYLYMIHAICMVTWEGGSIQETYAMCRDVVSYGG